MINLVPTEMESPYAEVLEMTKYSMVVGVLIYMLIRISFGSTESKFEVRYSPDFVQLPVLPTNKESILRRYDITSLVREKRAEFLTLLVGTETENVLSVNRVFLFVRDGKRVIYVDLFGVVEVDGRHERLKDDQFKQLKALLFTLIPERPPIE